MLPMRRSMDWTVKDNMVNGLLLCATLTSHKRGHVTLVWVEAETSVTGAEVVKPVGWQLIHTYADLGRAIPGRWMSMTWMKTCVSQCSPITLHSIGHSPRAPPSVIVRWTDELLCGGYKWVSRFEMPCIPTRWIGERWVEQVSRLHGTAC